MPEPGPPCEVPWVPGPVTQPRVRGPGGLGFLSSPFCFANSLFNPHPGPGCARERLRWRRGGHGLTLWSCSLCLGSCPSSRFSEIRVPGVCPLSLSSLRSRAKQLSKSTEPDLELNPTLRKNIYMPKKDQEKSHFLMRVVFGEPALCARVASSCSRPAFLVLPLPCHGVSRTACVLLRSFSNCCLYQYLLCPVPFYTGLLVGVWTAHTHLF